MFITYPAIFHKEDGSYWVEFPDLEGCQTFGNNLNEVVKMAQEALEGYILTILESGQELKSPSDVKSIEVDKDSFTSLVSCNTNDYKNSKAVKKTLTIPEWLDNLAVSKKVNFSSVLQEALIEKLVISK